MSRSTAAPAVSAYTADHSSHKKTIVYLLFSLPGIVYLFINNYIPMFGIFIAFKNLNYSVGVFQSKWVGLKNFEFLFRTPDASIIVRNTLLYNLGFIIIGTIFAIFVAILICELKGTYFAKISQASLLMPYLLSWIIISYIVYGYLSVDTGMLNKSILHALGISPVNWYGKPKAWIFILNFVYLWRNAGYSAIVYMASISGIDGSIFEAARIDGAGKLRQLYYITLPMIKPTVIIMTLLSIGHIFYSDFGLFYQVPMNSGLLYSTTQTIDTYVYRALMELGSLEMSAAAGVFQSIIGFVVVLGANLLVRKLDPNNALF